MGKQDELKLQSDMRVKGEMDKDRSKERAFAHQWTSTIIF